MKNFRHWRLAATLGLNLIAAIVIALPALSVLRFPLGATFFSAAFLLLALSFGATIWLYIFQGNQTFAAAKEANRLIKTIPLIFFTLDKQMQLSRLNSARFDEFFYGKNFGMGTDFAGIVGFLADAQTRSLGCDYVQLMLAQAKSSIPGTNPLECVSALMLNSDGRPELHYFKFAFDDYFENGNFAGILVAIHDISDVVNVNAQLQALTQKSDQVAQSSVDLLIRLIKLDRKTLQDKFISFENLLDEANLDLKDSGHSGVRYQTLADRVYKKIKLLRNEAAGLELTELSTRAAEMATELETLAQKAELSGNDFFSVALKLDELYDCLNKVSALFNQLPGADANLIAPTSAGLYTETPTQAATTARVQPPETVSQGDTDKNVWPQSDTDKHVTPQGNTGMHFPASESKFANYTPPASGDATALVDAAPTAPKSSATQVLNPTANPNSLRFEFALIQQACIRTAEKLGKKVTVHAQNLVAEAVPDPLKQTLTEILVQLIRSSLANGIELPAVRTAAGKDATGTLTLTWTELTNGGNAQGGYELVFRDDGCGLNFEAIRARALALNRLSATQAEALELRQLVGFIFEPGFSAAIKAGDNSGFGVGLDLVMAAAKRVGGKISVGTQAGLYTQFRVSFPELKELS